MRALSHTQTLIACVALVGVTTLGITDNMTESAITVIYSTVIGAVLGGVGAATANGVREKINGDSH